MPNWCEEHDHFKRSCPWCEIEELQVHLNQAIEALEHIREECSAQGSMFSESIVFFISETLQSIKGGETDVTQTSSRS